MKKTEGSQTSYSVYSQAGTLLHKKVGGVKTDYIYAGSLLVAEKTGTTTHYLHTDLLGSPVAGTNGSSYTEYYRPWGEKWSNPIPLADDVGYTGHQSDVATGLTYMQARYYDPVVGRFMAVDPVGFTSANPMSFNRYLYANNNPYKYTDPDGRFAIALACVGPQALLCGSAMTVAIVSHWYLTSTESGEDLVNAIGQIMNNESEDSSDSESSDADPVEGILGDAEPGEETKGRTTNYEKPGGMSQANSDFDTITSGGSSPIDPDDPDAGRKGQTGDGRNVNVRPNSTDGRPTLEIQDGKNRIKVRYDE